MRQNPLGVSLHKVMINIFPTKKKVMINILWQWWWHTVFLLRQLY